MKSTEDIDIEDLPLLAFIFPNSILDAIYKRDIEPLIKKSADMTRVYLELRARQLGLEVNKE